MVRKYGEGTFDEEKILAVSVFECIVDTSLKGVISRRSVPCVHMHVFLYLAFHYRITYLPYVVG
jgi:hypothetical protein